ncbi:S-adenosylmethionine decarboxylase proenzyme-like isoform X2 [Pollicipes pollicipes]|uniref:S-adenosylmethionine decarboxylase proenzyme-like n=1 Tax=Pollicipes pollicipes TaxID=41117 RepID=UPI001884F354|nr:S-adenosylmethionine decarboxylase proenzyme-like [Pollicipes pollicipes]XP_037080745.1 S-adenosylmethionine decarboxylase proenzyme-like isoform X2 [Pollicipes pollicipes]
MKEDIKEHFFEGVEKLLEVWVGSSSDHFNKNCDLRAIPREALDQLMEDAKCEIISTRSSSLVDAYVLSESSMFISRCRFILKTCGTTTPLKCIHRLLGFVKQYTSFTQVEDIFYSRKNFRHPHLQDETHRSFSAEVAALEDMFPTGSAYCLGKMNGDCWYLFTLDRPYALQAGGRMAPLPAPPPHAPTRRQPDQTLEVVMTDLGEDVMGLFYQSTCATAAEATKRSGIDLLLPGVNIDDVLFEPCGYSMNGLLDNGCYVTIHITPEPGFSYVSFETNIPQSCYKDVINRVIDCFKPGKVLVTVFANKTSKANAFTRQLCLPSIRPKYAQRDLQYCSVRGYDLVYGLFDCWPS